jgi:siroheme synthase
VVFVTGHEKDGHAERVDWHALAHCGLTLVIYMGILNAPKVQRHLLDAGLDPTTAVAAIESATLPGQRVVTMTLERMAAELQAQRVSSPAILVIGAVARGALAAVAAAGCGSTPGSGSDSGSGSASSSDSGSSS